MKSTTFFAIFSLILFKIINGQQNGLVFNENVETINPILQQPTRTYTMVNTVQDILNQNGNSAQLPNNLNQYQILQQTNVPPSTPSPQQIELPPELQQQPLQVQQYLQLQKPQPQQVPSLEQALQLQTQMQMQPLLQSQYPLQIEAQSPLLQDSLKLQKQVQVQPQQNIQIQQAVQSQQFQRSEQPIQALQQPLQSQQPVQALQFQQSLQSQQPVQALQFQQQLQSQQPVQALQLQQPRDCKQPIQKTQSLQLQQPLQSQESLQAPQPIQLQPLRYTQISPQQSSTIAERKNLIESPVTLQRNQNQPNPEIYVKWKSSNPQTTANVENNSQNLNNQPQQRYINRPVEVIANAQKSNSIPQDVSSLTYYVVSQQTPPQFVSPTSAPVVSIATIPSNYFKSAEQTHVPLLTPYNYVTPISEFVLKVPERTNTFNAIPAPSPILAISSQPIQSTNTQFHYYTQPAIDSRQNSGFHYPEQYQLPVTTLQSQPTVSVTSQPTISSSIPMTIAPVSSVSPQYGFPSYPVNTIMAPAYTSRRPKSSNLKSILPLIFHLLKEKLVSCSCKNDCPCECKNNGGENELEEENECSDQKNYRTFNNDSLSVLNIVSEEAEGLECLRETKNCDKIKKDSQELCDETLEEEDTAEEDFDEDEDS